MGIGWVKIHRKLLEWEWYDEPNTFRLFIHLLLKANHKPKNYRGVNIETGQVMTGFSLLAEQTGLTVQKVRTALSNLKSTNEITIKSSNKGTVIQIVKYVDYQVATSQTTNEQQTDNKRITTNKNDNKEKKEKKELVFDKFWNLYDKKIDTKSCKAKFLKLSNKDIVNILKVVKNYVSLTPDKQYRKNPLTWLNKESWKDESLKAEQTVRKFKKPTDNITS